MILIKHFLEPIESDDGDRLWVEPIGCTKDLQEWCKVDHMLPHLGPPVKIWKWFQQHPDGYEEFRVRYHEHLASGPYMEALQALASVALRETFTLLHQGDDPQHNTATALYDFLVERQAYAPPE
jgi:uncharacterized protein YeaO (DUF488 family)